MNIGLMIFVGFVVFAIFAAAKAEKTNAQKQKQNHSQAPKKEIFSMEKTVLESDTNIPLNKSVVKPKSFINVSKAPTVANNTNQPTHKHNEDGKSKYKVEQVPVSLGAGGKITEGCVEHYYERKIKLNPVVIEKAPTVDVQKLTKEDFRKAFILGEVINKRKIL